MTQPAAPAAKLSTGAVRRKALAVIEGECWPAKPMRRNGQLAEAILKAVDAAGLMVVEKGK
jgi:hypothetical protein